MVDRGTNMEHNVNLDSTTERQQTAAKGLIGGKHLDLDD